MLSKSLLRSPWLLNRAQRAVRSVVPSCDVIHFLYTWFLPMTKKNATRRPMNATAPTTIPAMAPPLRWLPDDDGEGLEVADEFGLSPSAGMCSHGSSW